MSLLLGDGVLVAIAFPEMGGLKGYCTSTVISGQFVAIAFPDIGLLKDHV
jgi:hypothetical protein